MSGGAGVGVGRIACVLPQRTQAVADLPELAMLGPAEAEFVASCGISTVGVFDGASNAELATWACRELLAGQPEEPDLLVLVGSRAPDALLGSEACQVQAECALSGTFAFAVDGLGCAGSSAAWALASDLLAGQPQWRSVLIVHASRPAGIDRIRYPVTVIGDGAFAMTVVRGGRPVLLAHRMETDGAFHDLFRLDYRQAPWYEWREECQSPDRYRFELAMHSRLRLARMVDEVLAEVGRDRSEVTTAVMQNVTTSAYAFYETLLGVPIAPVCAEHLARYGHLGAMDVVLNLDRLVRNGRLAPGDLVLVLNNSPVAAWTVTLWQI